MDEQRVPDLEGMDEQQAQHFLTEMFAHLSAETEYELRHEDYVLEMLQSGERIRGREKMRAFQRAFGTHCKRLQSTWVPACAGMTYRDTDPMGFRRTWYDLDKGVSPV